jgi:hypothetical protein
VQNFERLATNYDDIPPIIFKIIRRKQKKCPADQTCKWSEVQTLHVALGVGRVAAQRRLVDSLERNGQDTSEAQQLLARRDRALRGSTNGRESTNPNVAKLTTSLSEIKHKSFSFAVWCHRIGLFPAGRLQWRHHRQMKLPWRDLTRLSPVPSVMPSLGSIGGFHRRSMSMDSKAIISNA